MGVSAEDILGDDAFDNEDAESPANGDGKEKVRITHPLASRARQGCAVAAEQIACISVIALHLCNYPAKILGAKVFS